VALALLEWKFTQGEVLARIPQRLLLRRSGQAKNSGEYYDDVGAVDGTVDGVGR
jgi:hypothetical protein